MCSGGCSATSKSELFQRSTPGFLVPTPIHIWLQLKPASPGRFRSSGLLQRPAGWQEHREANSDRVIWKGVWRVTDQSDRSVSQGRSAGESASIEWTETVAGERHKPLQRPTSVEKGKSALTKPASAQTGSRFVASHPPDRPVTLR